MSMTVSVFSVVLPDDCLRLPDFDIDFWLVTEYDDDDFTDKDAEPLDQSDCLLCSIQSQRALVFSESHKTQCK